MFLIIPFIYSKLHNSTNSRSKVKGWRNCRSNAECRTQKGTGLILRDPPEKLWRRDGNRVATPHAWWCRIKGNVLLMALFSGETMDFPQHVSRSDCEWFYCKTSRKFQILLQKVIKVVQFNFLIKLTIIANMCGNLPISCSQSGELNLYFQKWNHIQHIMCISF